MKLEACCTGACLLAMVGLDAACLRDLNSLQLRLTLMMITGTSDNLQLAAVGGYCVRCLERGTTFGSDFMEVFWFMI